MNTFSIVSNNCSENCKQEYKYPVKESDVKNLTVSEQYYDTDQKNIKNLTLEGDLVNDQWGLNLRFFTNNFTLKNMNLSALIKVPGVSPKVNGFVGLEPVQAGEKS